MVDGQVVFFSSLSIKLTAIDTFTIRCKLSAARLHTLSLSHTHSLCLSAIFHLELFLLPLCYCSSVSEEEENRSCVSEKEQLRYLL